MQRLIAYQPKQSEMAPPSRPDSEVVTLASLDFPKLQMYICSAQVYFLTGQFSRPHNQFIQLERMKAPAPKAC
jgi:hypothetical protein